MTPTEILNNSYQRLMKQGAASTGVSGKGCFYRDEEGKGCAVGVLIEDDELCAILDQEEANSVESVESLLPAYLQGHIELLTELQWVHDSELTNVGTYTFEECLTVEYQRVAKRFELELEEYKESE